MKKEATLKKGVNKNTTDKTEIVKKSFKCHLCNKSGFSTSYKLKSHLFLHKAISPRFKCSHCAKEFYRSDVFARHSAQHQKKQKLHFCDYCERGFVDKRNLILHLNIHDDLPRLGNQRYKCNACDVDYCEERLLKYHIRKVHLNLNPIQPVHLSKKLNESWIENVMDTKSCVQITKVSPNILTIKRSKIERKKDTKENVEKNSFQQYIASVFASKANNYSKAICDYCGKEMLKKSIVGHIREGHLQLRRFHCEVCKRTFKRHYQLCLHACGQNRRRRRKTEKPSDL